MNKRLGELTKLISDVFGSIDTDGSQTLDAKELKTACEKMGLRLTD